MSHIVTLPDLDLSSTHSPSPPGSCGCPKNSTRSTRSTRRPVRSRRSAPSVKVVPETLPSVSALRETLKEKIASQTTPKRQYDSREDLVENNAIDQMLEEEGYQITAKVLVQGDAGNEARYLEVTDKDGHKAFVELDTGGYVAIEPDDFTLVEGALETVIPYSTKRGALECAGSSCGVAFVCQNGICTIERIGVELPHEKTFVYSNKVTERTGQLGDQAVPYPIIRLSELRENPSEVLATIDEVTRRIRNSAYQKCMDDIQQTQEAIEELSDAFKKFSKTEQNAADRLLRTMKKLEELNEYYSDNPPQNDESLAQHRLILQGLQRRHQMAVDLLYLCSEVTVKREILVEWSRMLNSVTEGLLQEFENVDYL